MRRLLGGHRVHGGEVTPEWPAPLIQGEPVVVLRQRQTRTDALGEPLYSLTAETVPNVLCDPGSTRDLGRERPDGVRVDAVFHFPKGYGGDLRGAAIRWRGRTFEVVGAPLPYKEDLTPGPWNLTVEGRWVDG